jgi:hypothetical protein
MGPDQLDRFPAVDEEVHRAQQCNRNTLSALRKAPRGALCFRTEYNYQGAPFERTDVVFEGVEAYSFRVP